MNNQNKARHCGRSDSDQVDVVNFGALYAARYGNVIFRICPMSALDFTIDYGGHSHG